jgi:hypothetical protein
MNPPNRSPEPTEDRLPCPFCAEMIISAAVLCRFCGRELPGNWATVARGASRSTPRQPTSRPRIRPSIRIAALLVLLIAIAFVLQPKQENTGAPSSTAVSSTANKDSDERCRRFTTDRQRDAARSMIQARGYDCKTVDAMCPYVFSEGFTVYCNNLRYVFEIENHGGIWSVSAK